jgi:hypothetical protein
MAKPSSVGAYVSFIKLASVSATENGMKKKTLTLNDHPIGPFRSPG